MGGGTFFKVGGHKCTSKTIENLRFELPRVTSQALKHDVITYTPYEGPNQWFSKWVESPQGSDRGVKHTKGTKTLNHCH